MGTIYPALCAKLSDDNDDVVSAAAAAILPILLINKTSSKEQVKLEPGNAFFMETFSSSSWCSGRMEALEKLSFLKVQKLIDQAFDKWQSDPTEP